MTHLKEGQWLFTTGEGRVPAFAFGTSGISADRSQHSVFSALKAGFRHIDYAPLYLPFYGNEAEVGKAITQALSQGLLGRDEVFVTMKLLCTHQDPQDVLLCLQQSLRDLQFTWNM